MTPAPHRRRGPWGWFDGRRTRAIVRRGNAARDAGDHAAAAALYGEGLAIDPGRFDIHVQHGHMLKEAGRLDAAEAAYLAAQRLRPDDADLALHLGHLHKRAGRWGEACLAYARALDLQPGWDEPERELDALLARAVMPGAAGDASRLEPAQMAGLRRRFAALEQLAPALVPRDRHDLLVDYREEVAIRQLGRRETTAWGNRAVLRGLEAIRGVCLSEQPVAAVEVLLDGISIHRGPLKGGYALKAARDPDRLRKYVFNLWIDFSDHVPGRHAIALVLTDAGGQTRTIREEVVIADPVLEQDWPDSNFLVSLAPGDPRPINEQVRARPSMVRPARRTLFPDGVRNVLVIRIDQLGDMVASVPALVRLREMLPEARLVGLFGPANAEFAGTLGILDEIIVADVPDDPLERRRILPIGEQKRLRNRLAPFGFDIAIDLAQSKISRDLLRLADARLTYGTGGEDWPWLSADFTFHTRDRWTRHDFTPHSSKVLALVEALGTLLTPAAPILRRPDLARAGLERYGLPSSGRFCVLHAGARIGFSRWPHYGALARLLLERTDLHIVILTEDPGFAATLGDLRADPWVTLIDRRLPFDDLDALLSFATVMAGNDSGPKHLAALRGTPVVTLFSARINWTEWGQETVGTIISRKLPCAGCALLHDPEECGRDFACITDIRVDEVFAAMIAYIDGADGA